MYLVPTASCVYHLSIRYRLHFVNISLRTHGFVFSSHAFFQQASNQSRIETHYDYKISTAVVAAVVLPRLRELCRSNIGN